MSDYLLEKFHRGLEELGIALSETQEKQFLLYYETLIAWNRSANLTTITGFDDVVSKHFLDSLCLVKAVSVSGDQRVLDVGTGAGFPGLPLKIVFPGMHLVLLDSVGKKLKFVDAVIEKLKLSEVTTVHGRAEDLAREEAYRERFDLCVSRAVADLAVLAEYCLPFVRVDGCFVAYKSANIAEETLRAEKAISLLGGETEEVLTYTLPGAEDGRSLVCVRKTQRTPREYPRKAGTPPRHPLQ